MLVLGIVLSLIAVIVGIAALTVSLNLEHNDYDR